MELIHEACCRIVTVSKKERKLAVKVQEANQEAGLVRAGAAQEWEQLLGSAQVQKEEGGREKVWG